MNRNYLAGRRLEYDCMKRWKLNGYTVARSAGSHGVWDVCAVKPRQPVILIQCKRVETEGMANTLVRKFRETPPMVADRYYTQVLEIKVKGSHSLITASV